MACSGQLLIGPEHHLRTLPCANPRLKSMRGADFCSCPMMEAEVSPPSLHYNTMALKLPSTPMNKRHNYKNPSLITYVFTFKKLNIRCASSRHMLLLSLSSVFPNRTLTTYFAKSSCPLTYSALTLDNNFNNFW